MKPLNNKEIFGNWATLLLPINKDESINYNKLADEIDFLISCKVNGIYSNGTAGEFYNQTEDEFDKVNLLLAEKCNAAKMPFQIGCAHMSPQISLERLKRAVELKPSAIQVILPDWFPPTIQESIVFLGRMAELADPVGLVLYNPPHSKKKLTPEEFYQIMEAGIPLVGCKVAGGDENWYRQMKNLVPQLSLFIPGHYLATGIKSGAHGAYSNVACLHPKAAQDWYDLMSTNMDQAFEIEQRILYFMNTYIQPFIKEKGYSNQAVDKLLAAIGGWADIGTRLRWPYQWIGEGEVEKVRPACRSILPEFFFND
ncbi:MAG TPA: dihydrodipicolinate synthase family protein [Cytophagales bacterium]|nr:dihydrodipicolinate synthase family protein [Cytophagales bacterium]